MSTVASLYSIGFLPYVAVARIRVFRHRAGRVHLHCIAGPSSRVVDHSRSSWHVIVPISRCDVWEVKGWLVTFGANGPFGMKIRPFIQSCFLAVTDPNLQVVLLLSPRSGVECAFLLVENVVVCSEMPLRCFGQETLLLNGIY